MLASKNIVIGIYTLVISCLVQTHMASQRLLTLAGLQILQGTSFVPFDLPDTEPYRIFHPPEQRVFAGGMYQYGMCTTKFDVYSMAVNLIELVYDSSEKRAVDWMARCLEISMC